MSVEVLNVGKAGCAVVKHLEEDSRSATIMDVGSWKPLEIWLKSAGVSKIRRIFLTHLDMDHCVGMFGVLKAVRSGQVAVEQVIVGVDFRSWCQYEEIQEETAVVERRLDDELVLGPSFDAGPRRARAAALSLRLLAFSNQQPNSVRVGQQGDNWHDDFYEISVLWPPGALILHAANALEVLEDPGFDRNEMSLALRVSRETDSSTRSLVYAGDCTAAGFVAADQSQADIWNCDVLVYPHHGGRVADGGEEAQLQGARAILRVTRPDVVVIQNRSDTSLFPRASTVAAIKHVRPDARIICTGLSSMCCDAARGMGGACAGNVLVDLSSDDLLSQGGGVKTERFDHRGFVRTDPVDGMCVAAAPAEGSAPATASGPS
jgi:beta-lactamase superfamily II metal-dependent hydrolase